jgi:hypothetical protein
MKKTILWAIYLIIALGLVSCGSTNNPQGASSSSKAMTAYSFSNPAAIGNINESDKTITITVPYGTDVTGLVATFTTTGASVTVGETVQVSGTTANDFTDSVVYAVTAADGSTTNYTVTVTVALNSSKAITSFSILGISGAINESTKTITLSVPYGMDVTGLVATFTTTGASVTVGETVQVSGTTANDFSGPVVYEVTAADGSKSSYNVTVSASVIKLPMTGQIVSFGTSSSGPIDDGALQRGISWPNPRFTNPDGTTPINDNLVVDQLTGLMWTKDSNAPGPAACSPGTAKTWQEALDYAVCLNANNYLGYADWRIPNVNELKSLINYGSSSNESWLSSVGFTNMVYGNMYWSSTTQIIETNATGKGQAYVLYIYILTGAYKTESHFAWPVRGGSEVYNAVVDLPKTGQIHCFDSSTAQTQIACSGTGQDGDLQKGIALQNPRFIDNMNQTITDNLTGLMWTKDANIPGPAVCSPATTKTWQDSLIYINCLNNNNYLGYSDWRLPNINELESLLNYEQSDNSTWLLNNGFTNVKDYFYWSSTTNSGYTAGAWVQHMRVLGYGFNYKTESNYVWPVRAGL